MKLYIAVTPDEFELPLYVADSAQDLADKFGVTRNLVESSISRNKNGKRSGRKFIKVEIKDV